MGHYAENLRAVRPSLCRGSGDRIVHRTHREAERLDRKFKAGDSERTRGFAWLVCAVLVCGRHRLAKKGRIAHLRAADPPGTGYWCPHLLRSS